MKTIEDVTRSIDILASTGCNLSFYLVERNGTKDNYTYNIHSPSINQDIIEDILEALHSNLKLMISKNESTVTLDPMFSEDSTLEIINEDEVGCFLEIKNCLLTDQDINIIDSFKDVDLSSI